RALLDSCLALDEERRGRRLQDEREGLVGIDGDLDRQDRILALRLCIELLAKGHDVDALRTESRTDRRGRIRLACRNLQLDETGDLLGHLSLWENVKRARAPSHGRAGDAR